MERIVEVDTVRGIAIVMMVIYHFFLDMDFFQISEIDLSGISWIVFQRAIAFTFVFIAGISLVLMKRKKKGKWDYVKRAAFLGAIALVITAVTWIYPHERFIMFGIIHLIALSTLIAPLFFSLGSWNLLLAIVLIIGGFFLGTAPIEGTDYFFWLGVYSPSYWPLDYYPLIPWFGIILLEMYSGQRLFTTQNIERMKNDGTKNILIQKLAFLGRNSLLIYLIHQPILVALITILSAGRLL